MQHESNLDPSVEGTDRSSRVAGGSTLPAVPATELTGLARAPRGISFLQVPAPPDQPSLPVDETVPDPLPATVDFSDVADVPAADADLLGRWVLDR